MSVVRDGTQNLTVRRSFAWRTAWIYVGLGPLIGSSIALLLFAGFTIYGAFHGGRPQDLSGLITVLPLGYMMGFVLGTVPAICTGLAAAFLHRPAEPIPRSLVVGGALGAIATEVWVFAMNGFHPTTPPIAISLAGIGAFAGATCALLQRLKQ